MANKKREERRQKAIERKEWRRIRRENIRKQEEEREQKAQESIKKHNKAKEKVRVPIPGMRPDLVPQYCMMMRDHTIRDVRKWKPKGKGYYTQLWSLIQHAYCKYPMPKTWIWLWVENRSVNAFGVRVTYAVPEHRQALKMAFGAIANGDNPRKVLNKFLGLSLTKKAAHLLTTCTLDIQPVHAIRWAQVKAAGGSDWLAERFMLLQDWGTTFKYEERRQHVIEWAVKQFCKDDHGLNPDQIRPLLDYIDFKINNDPEYKLSGRTLRSVHKAMLDWHVELAKAKAKGEFKPSGFQEAVFVEEDMFGHEYLLTIKEILSKQELAEEGKRQRHCVYIYSASVERGAVSIWSLREDGKKPLLTIELINRDNRVVQVRGKLNRKATAKEMKYVREWAQKNNLSLDSHL